jgi:Ser/Thr protein kinase RdoA (MazF antagonist)
MQPDRARSSFAVHPMRIEGQVPAKNMLDSIIAQFSIPGRFIRAGRFGSGLINDTFLCVFEEGGTVRKYVLQRINRSVFKRPDQVMENVELVTGHIEARLRAAGVRDSSTIMPALVRSRSGPAFHLDEEGSCWRVFHFIESGEVFDTVQDASHAYEIGRAIGRFQALVADLPPDRLHDTLPGFHHTPRCLADYEDALNKAERKRVEETAAERAFVEQRRPLAPVLTHIMGTKDVPFRIVHNDPKVNNIMVHAATHEALCMLDLDTVQAGIVHFDFGDCVRSAANPAGEDAKSLGAVSLDLDLFQAIAKGYIREAGGFLTGKEIDLLSLSVKVLTFELGLRFLADHLRGDAYFRTVYPGHNLHRARVQFRLLESMEAAGEKMAETVRTIAAGRVV